MKVLGEGFGTPDYRVGKNKYCIPRIYLVDITNSIMIHFRGAKIISYIRVSVLDRDARLIILGQVGRELEDTRSGIQTNTLQMLV